MHKIRKKSIQGVTFWTKVDYNLTINRARGAGLKENKMKDLDPTGTVTINRNTMAHFSALRRTERAIVLLINNPPYHPGVAMKAVEIATQVADILWQVSDLVLWSQMVENMSMFFDDHVEEDFRDGLIEFHSSLEGAINNSVRRSVGL